MVAKRRALLSMASAAISALFFTGVAHATDLDFWIDRKNEQITFQLTGNIKEGVTDRLRAIVASIDLPINLYDYRALIKLESNGGSWTEGIELAELFRELKIETVVENGSVCLSACAIAFLGGTAFHPEGGNIVSRSIDKGALLGFHAPFLNLPERGFSKNDVELSYAVATKEILRAVVILREMAVDPSILAELLIPSRRSFNAIDNVDEVGRLGLHVAGLMPRTSLDMEMITQYCRNAYSWKHNFSASNPDFPEKKNWVTADDVEPRQMIDVPSEYPKGTFRRTLIAVADGPEGSYDWCVFDDYFSWHTSQYTCQGFIDAKTVEQVEQRLEALEVYDAIHIPCDYPQAANPRGFDLGVNWTGFYPPATMIMDIE